MAAGQPLLTRLALTDFRNHRELTWTAAARLTVLHGPNGSGKTNFLEAASLLVPGRGLRGARVADLPRHGASRWGIAARLADGTEMGTGSAPDGPPDRPPDRRVFRLNGAAPRSQAEVAAHLSAVWLTPQMDRLFQEGATGRRRFLDRLVQALEPGHARQVASHDTAMAGRRRVLAEAGEPAWLDALEDAAARHGVAVSVARRTLTQRLDAALRDGAAAPFPAARITVLDAVARDGPALATEDWLRGELRRNRARDAAAGTALVGAHRADFTLADAATGLPAHLASTGQQKAMLVGLVLGHAALIADARGVAPLLLLDEPLVHLDATRRTALFTALTRLPAQAFLTGTDAEPFAPLREAAFVEMGEGKEGQGAALDPLGP